MKKGLIICGYPGIGKSSIAGWNNCIDLESSYFSFRNGVPQKFSEWVPQYCDLADHLMWQGYTVLISTHEKVIEYFLKKRNDVSWYPAIIVCPEFKLCDDWLRRLSRRLNKYDPYYSKNERAFLHVYDHFMEDIVYLNECGLPIYTITSIDYFLQDVVKDINEVKERSPSFDLSKVFTPFDPMAGVEESGLDVPVVEEITDISRNHSE